MELDLQKAGLWKRMAARLLDFIMIMVLAVGFGTALSFFLKYDTYSNTMDVALTEYENKYSVDFQITPEDFASLSEGDRERYNEAFDAFYADEEVVHAYNMVINLTFVIVTIGILLSVITLEFVLPIFLGNGQTIGKKIFGLSLMRIDHVKISNMQLFVRALLGIYTIELMIPIFLVILSLLGALNGFIVLVIILIFSTVQLFMAASSNGYVVHDRLAGTVVVEHNSQRIFNSAEERIEYQKKLAAERASEKTY